MGGRGNHISFGPVTVRVGSKNLAPWGFPILQIGGLSFWSRTNSGGLHLLAYHPRSSITWLWFVALSGKAGRGYWPTFSRQERERIARLFVTGNPYAFRIRWWHRFVQFAPQRRGQWSDHFRLPFGLVLTITHQARMERR